jgi:mRNA interferase YafQ
MRTIKQATAFRRDHRKIRSTPKYRDIDTSLSPILELLAGDRPLPASNRDHALSGDWSGYRECHVRPDLLLIYGKPDAELSRLVRLGSHSDLFG